MRTTSIAGYRVFAIYILLTFYCFGAAMVNEFPEYYGWSEAGKYMSSADFATWLTYTSHIRIPILVLPMIVTTIFALLQLRYLPAQISRASLWIVLGCHAIAWASTFIFQVPIEMQLAEGGFNADAMRRLLLTDWLRKCCLFVEVLTVLYMINRLIQAMIIKTGAGFASRKESKTSPLIQGGESV